MILDYAARDPQGLALTDGTRRRSWAELADRVTRLANGWRGAARGGPRAPGLGLRPADRVALLLGNRAEGVEAVLAAIAAGLWATPVNRHATPDEVAYVVKDAGARAVLTDPEHEAVARAAAGAAHVLVAGPDLEAFLADASDAPLDLDGPAGGNMIYTSGTTGRPKGVMRRRPPTLAQAFAGHEAYARSIRLDGSGPHLVTGPLYHAAPLMFAVYDLQLGAPVVVMPRWDERDFLRLVLAHGVHHTHLVPTMFVRLLRLPEDERAAFRAPHLHSVLHGAAPVSVPVKRRMIDWWGPVLLEYWGGTEGGVTTLVDSEAWLARPGTVGRAVPPWEVFAVDEAGRRLPPGETGVLYSRHPAQERFFAYHGAPEKTDAAYLDPHTFTLGDVGRVDAEGFVWLWDRKSHVIISGGVNVYPAEVEQVLQEHPAVADVCVFGVPDDEWGESVKAAVELLPGHAPDEALAEGLRAFARERLAGFKVPRSVDFEPRLPRTPAGKVRVRELRERYWQGRERRI